MEESIPQLGTERNDMKRIGYTKNPASANRIGNVFLSQICFGKGFREFASFSVPQNGIPSWSSSAEWFGTEFREFGYIFIPRYTILSFFLLCGIIWNGIPRVFYSTEQLEFLHVYSVFHGIIFFCRKLPTLVRRGFLSPKF
jgi:hypothetical protein